MGGFGFGKLWEVFGLSIVCLSPRLWEALGSFGTFREALRVFGRLWYASEGFGMLWKALEGFGRHEKALGGFCMFWDALKGFWEALAASVRLCKALVQWMLWKVLEALGVFERY